jgi:type II secretion system protein H
MRRAAFTLVELVLVLAILAWMAAFIAPALAKSSRQRALDQEGMRIIATMEYARNEAVSTGVAMAVYVDTQAQSFGMEPASESSGVDVHKEFTLHPDLHFDAVEGGSSAKSGRVITFTPEGVAATGSVDSIGITDRTGANVRIVRDSNAWGYEIAKGATR